jgi:hypothetical protein
MHRNCSNSELACSIWAVNATFASLGDLVGVCRYDNVLLVADKVLFIFPAVWKCGRSGYALTHFGSEVRVCSPCSPSSSKTHPSLLQRFGNTNTKVNGSSL